MRTLWIILACFLGVFGFAFLLAGLLDMQENQPPKERRETLLRIFDYTFLGGITSMCGDVEKNWRNRPEGRRFLWLGLGLLGGSLLFAILAGETQ